MNSLSFAARDSMTMFRREVRHALRFPIMTISGLAVPIFFLLLFVGVFGNTMRAGLSASFGTHHYVNYLVPGVILMTVGSAAESTALNVCTDMREGIIARFRTMAISRTSVLTGQVAGSVLRTLMSGVLVVGVVLALGFRPTATPVEWVAVTGMFLLLSIALTWLAVVFGLFAKTPAGANSLALLLVVLPFISSVFVPTASMPAGVRWFAQNQPFTPVIETLRGLLNGTAIGHSSELAIAWCAGIAVIGYMWAWSRYNRNERLFTLPG